MRQIELLSKEKKKAVLEHWAGCENVRTLLMFTGGWTNTCPALAGSEAGFMAPRTVCSRKRTSTQVVREVKVTHHGERSPSSSVQGVQVLRLLQGLFVRGVSPATLASFSGNITPSPSNFQPARLTCRVPLFSLQGSQPVFRTIPRFRLRLKEVKKPQVDTPPRQISRGLLLEARFASMRSPWAI